MFSKHSTVIPRHADDDKAIVYGRHSAGVACTPEEPPVFKRSGIKGSGSFFLLYT